MRFSSKFLPAILFASVLAAPRPDAEPPEDDGGVDQPENPEDWNVPPMETPIFDAELFSKLKENHGDLIKRAVPANTQQAAQVAPGQPKEDPNTDPPSVCAAQSPLKNGNRAQVNILYSTHYGQVLRIQVWGGFEAIKATNLRSGFAGSEKRLSRSFSKHMANYFDSHGYPRDTMSFRGIYSSGKTSGVVLTGAEIQTRIPKYKTADFYSIIKTALNYFAEGKVQVNIFRQVFNAFQDTPDFDLKAQTVDYAPKINARQPLLSTRGKKSEISYRSDQSEQQYTASPLSPRGELSGTCWKPVDMRNEISDVSFCGKGATLIRCYCPGTPK